MDRTQLIRLLLVAIALAAGFALGDGTSEADPDGNGLIPFVLLFGSLTGLTGGGVD